MISSRLPHNFKALHGFILIFLLGLLAVGIYDGLGKKRLSVDAHQSDLLLLSSSTNGAISLSAHPSSPDETSSQIGPDNLLNGFADLLLVSFANNTMSEDERIDPQILPFYLFTQQIDYSTHQRLTPVYFQHCFTDLSLVILSTVVFLH